MMITKALATLAILLGTATSAHAETLNNIDITPAVAYFKQYVHTLTQPVYVYNWSQSIGSAWGQVTDAKAPIGLTTAQGGSVSFWGNYGKSDGGGNMYGYGLYAAVDPEATENYGGWSEDQTTARWILLQLHLPVGFRLLDLARDQMILPDNVRAIVNQFSCYNNEGEAFDPFQTGMPGSQCATLIRQLFQYDLPLDGFLYAYDGINYAACQNSPGLGDRQAAMVITSNRLMTAANVEVFTPHTNNVTPERLIIETLMDSNTASGDVAPAFDPESDGNRWADLIKAQPVPTIGTWIKSNLFGCGDHLPYTDNTPH